MSPRDLPHEARGHRRAVLQAPAIRILYAGVDGQESATRFRISLDGGFRWKKGDKPVPYGLAYLPLARECGYIILVEGESDVHTLLYNGKPALGIPGAGLWKEAWADDLDGIGTIFVVIEPGGSGETMLKWIAKSKIRDRVKLVSLAPYKDPSALWVAHPDMAAFKAVFEAALDAAEAWPERERRAHEAEVEALRVKCSALAQAPAILDRVVQALHTGRGLVGEDGIAKLLYLVKLTAITLDRPASMIVKGPAAVGKNFIAESVLALFPPTSYHAWTSMSQRALVYDKIPLAHTTLVLYEQAGLDDERGFSCTSSARS